MDALLLGRRTYDIFAGYWPRHGDSEVGRVLNRIPRYVASRDSGNRLDWPGSTRVGDALAAEIAGLREQHEEVHVIGSLDLVQTLVAERIWGSSDADEMRLWIYPVVLGEGRRVFPAGAAPSNLHLIKPPVSGSAGAVLLRYASLPGEPEIGIVDDSGPDSSEA